MGCGFCLGVCERLNGNARRPHAKVTGNDRSVQLVTEVSHGPATLLFIPFSLPCRDKTANLALINRPPAGGGAAPPLFRMKRSTTMVVLDG